MIYTLTLNPAIDLYTELRGTFMLGRTNRTEMEYVLPGGKGINCSLVLNKLGAVNEAIAFVSGPTGIMLGIMLESRGVNAHLINVSDTNAITRINLKIKSMETGTDTETEINGNGPNLTSEDLSGLRTYLETVVTSKDFVIISGNAPSSLGPDVYHKLTSVLVKNGVPFSLDCENQLLINTLSNKPWLIKPNLSELETIAGHKLDNKFAIREEADYLISLGAQNVLVSLGADGSMLITPNNEVIEVPPYINEKASIVSTNGAGDTLLAAFVYYTQVERLDYREALNRANRLAGETCYLDRTNI